MRPLDASEIRGTWATLLLPIDPDDGIDYGRLGREIDALVASGVDGIYSNGTAGEFHNQTEDEFDRVNALLAERCVAAGLPFQVGCCHMSPRIALERLRRARAWSPSAVQVTLPDWLPLSFDEMRRFLARLAEEAAPIGLVLYNPPHAKQRPSLMELERLAAAVPAIRGFKLPGGDAEWYAEMRARLGHLSVFVPGHELATGLRSGARGSYSNVSCLNPGAAALWNARMAAEPEAALELEGRLQSFMAAHVVPLRDRYGVGNPALDKALAAIGGWADIGTRLRWPYASVPDEEIPRLRGIARRALPEFFEAGTAAG